MQLVTQHNRNTPKHTFSVSFTLVKPASRVRSAFLMLGIGTGQLPMVTFLLASSLCAVTERTVSVRTTQTVSVVEVRLCNFTLFNG